MKRVDRSEILDWQTYADQRDELRASALAAKGLRRVVVADTFTFLFENAETVRYQVQEMMRVERIVRETEIQHELDTYNELLHDAGTLGCSLLIGIDDEAKRDVLLREWLDLLEHVYAERPDGSKARPGFDPRQVGEDRLSSVQYLTFEIGAEAPVAIGVDRPGIEARVELSAEQRAALGADLTAS